MSTQTTNASHAISTLNEKPLHAALKEWYALPGDRFEVPVDGSLIDIVRGDLLIEIQTRGFGALRRKLQKLTASHRVRLVHPIAQEKWIVRESPDGRKQLGRRRSSRRGTVEHLFSELVRIPALMAHPNFSLELLMVSEEEVRRKDGGRHWRRRGWATHERRLIDVLDRWIFETPDDLGDLLPPGLPDPFTTADLAAALGHPRSLAQQMTYCLRAMGTIESVGKIGRTILYRCAAAQRP